MGREGGVEGGLAGCFRHEVLEILRGVGRGATKIWQNGCPQAESVGVGVVSWVLKVEGTAARRGVSGMKC